MARRGIGYIPEMVMEESYRGQGVGTSLLQAAIDDAKRNGCKRIELDTSFHRKEASRFYGKKGLRSGPIFFRNNYSHNIGKTMRNIMRLLIAGLLPLVAICVYAANADDILGVWYNQEKDAKIEIFKCGEKYCGKVVWLKEPNYPAGSTEGTPGTPRLDHNNPDPTLRSNPIMGLRIVHDFVFMGDGLWKGGKVYDPKNGKTYRGKMTLVSPGQLNLRGFIGISLIGRTAIWTR